MPIAAFYQGRLLSRKIRRLDDGRVRVVPRASSTDPSPAPVYFASIDEYDRLVERRFVRELPGEEDPT